MNGSGSLIRVWNAIQSSIRNSYQIGSIITLTARFVEKNAIMWIVLNPALTLHTAGLLRVRALLLSVEHSVLAKKKMPQDPSALVSPFKTGQEKRKTKPNPGLTNILDSYATKC